MKKVFLLIGLLLSFQFSNAQTAKQNVERDFKQYCKLIEEKKTAQALEYINPKIFEIISKEDMKRMMDAVYKMPNIEYKITLPIITEMSESQKIGNVDYLKFKIVSPLELRLTNMEMSESNISMLLHSLELKFGNGNVKYDESTGFFKINAHKKVVASSTDNQHNWKFITIDNEDMKVLLEKIIPAEILN